MTDQTTRGISASIASSIPLAANGGLLAISLCNHSTQHQPWDSSSYGTKIAEAVAPVSFTASLTVAKTGRSRCVVPAFLGFVPPTTCVPKCCGEWLILFTRGRDPLGGGGYHRQWLAPHETFRTKEMSTSLNQLEEKKISLSHHIRPLFSSETLENDLGILVYAKVLNSFSVGRGSVKVSSSLHGSDILEGRERATSESLHGCKGVIKD